MLVAVVIVAIVLLRLMGAPALLILEVFGLAIILGVSAIIMILVMSGRLSRKPR